MLNDLCSVKTCIANQLLQDSNLLARILRSYTEVPQDVAQTTLGSTRA